MKGAIIGPDRDLELELKANGVRLGRTLQYDVIPYQELDSDEQILELLTNMPYSWIVFKLSLDRYLALRIAEIAHRIRSATKLILISGTRVSRSVLLGLFDFFNPGQGEGGLDDLERAFGSGGTVRRLSSKSDINNTISNIMKESTCWDVREVRKVPKERHCSPEICGWKEEVTHIHPYIYNYHKRWEECPTPTSIFINYRREDSRHVADRIDERLARHFGRKRVFKDIYSIEPGQDVRMVIRDAVGRADVLLLSFR